MESKREDTILGSCSPIGKQIIVSLRNQKVVQSDSLFSKLTIAQLAGMVGVSEKLIEISLIDLVGKGFVFQHGRLFGITNKGIQGQ